MAKSNLEDLGSGGNRGKHYQMPDELIQRMRFEGKQIGVDLEIVVEEAEQKIREAEPYIQQLLAHKELLAETIRATSQDFSTLDEKSRNRIAASLEKASAATGKQISLARDAENLERQAQQMLSRAEKDTPRFRNIVTKRRDEIGNILAPAPQAVDFIRERQEIRRHQDIEETVKGMNLEQLRKSLPKRDIEGIDKTIPENDREAVTRERVIDHRKREDWRQKQRADELLANSQVSDEFMRDRDEDDFKKIDLPKIIEGGHATQAEAADYLQGKQTRDEFLDQFGPDISAGYIRNRIAPTVDDADQGGGGMGGDTIGPTGALGPDPDDIDPINVRVVNEDTDPIPIIELGEGIGGGPGGGGPGGGPGGGQNNNDISSAFGRQEIGNILAGLENIGTPGGPPLAGSILGGIGGIGRAGMQFFDQGRNRITEALARRQGIDPTDAAGMKALRGTVTRGLGVAGGLGATAVTAGHAYLNVAGHQRGLERSFGEDQTINMNPFAEGSGDMMLGSELLQSQVAQRIQHPLMGGEEIQQLTDELARLGATADEAAEALGPAADALDRYRVLTPEMAARSARRGQQFSPIGGAEAEVLGGVLEDLSGQGFAAETLRETATTAAETFEAMGVAGGEYAALGRTNFLSGSDNPQLDMLLENVTNQGTQGAQRLAEDPISQGQMLAAVTGNAQYADLNMSDRPDQVLLQTAPEDIISQFNPAGLAPNERTGESIDITDTNNWERVQADPTYALLQSAGYNYSPQEFLASVLRIQEAGGIEGVRAEVTQTMEDEENRRTAIQEDATGVTQERQIQASEEARMSVPGFLGTRISTMGGEEGGVGGFFNNVRRAAADASGIDALGPQNTLDRGTLGSNDASTRSVYNNEDLDPQLRAPSSIAGIDLGEVMVETADGDIAYSEAVKNEDIARQLAEGQQIVKLGEDRVSVEELTTGARAGEIEASNQSILGRWWNGDDNGIKRVSDDGNGRGVEVFFTGEAERFFTTKDPTSPETMTGQSNDANAGWNVGTGHKEANRSGNPSVVNTRQ